MQNYILVKHLKLGVFWLHLSIIGKKKHLVIEWLCLLPYKSSFINSDILESSKDRPNTPTGLKCLEERVLALLGGSHRPPPLPQTRLWGAKGLEGLDQEG